MFKTTEGIGFLVLLFALCGLSNAVQGGIDLCEENYGWFVFHFVCMYFCADLVYSYYLKLKVVYDLEVYEEVWIDSKAEWVSFLHRARSFYDSGKLDEAKEALRRFEEARDARSGS